MARCQISMRRFIPILAFALACAESAGPQTLPNTIFSEPDTKTGQVIITEDADDARWPSDPVTIKAAEVKGDSLWMTVSFGGGCRGHSFLLLADGAWMESYPVQTGVRLAHEDNNDNCKALVTRLLKWDLVPLKQAYARAYGPASGMIRINLRASGPSVLYKW